MLPLLFLDLPVQQESKGGTQRDDAGDDRDLLPLPHDDGTQDLAAHLELEAHRKAAGKIDARIAGPLQPFDKPGDAAPDDDPDTDKFEQDDGNGCDMLKKFF